MTAQTEAEKTGELGKARLRKEDERLITGQTNWTDNITLPGMLHIAFLRSPYAHARITSVDLSAAHAGVRLYGPEGSFTVVDQALADALEAPDALDGSGRGGRRTGWRR